MRICNYDQPLIPCDKTGGRCYEDMELLGTKRSRHVNLGDLIQRSMQVYCLELMQSSWAKRWIPFDRFFCHVGRTTFQIYSLSLDKTNLSKNTRRQSSSAPSPNISRHQKLSHDNSTEQMPRFAFPVVVPQARAVNHDHEDLARVPSDTQRAI